MAIPAVAAPQTLIPGSHCVVASVQLAADITTAQTLLVNKGSITIIPTHVVVRAFSGAANSTSATITVVVDGITVGTLATVVLAPGTGSVLVPLSVSGTVTANRALIAGKTMTLALSAASAAGTVVQADVLGYGVAF